MIIRAGILVFLFVVGVPIPGISQDERAPVYELLPEEAGVPLIHPSRTQPALEVDPAERSFEIETDLLQQDIKRRKTAGQRQLEAQDRFSDGLRPAAP